MTYMQAPIPGHNEPTLSKGNLYDYVVQLEIGNVGLTMSNAEQDQLVERFVAVTNSSKYLAEQFLSRNNYDLVNAIEDYYATSPPPARSNKGSGRKEKRCVLFID